MDKEVQISNSKKVNALQKRTLVDFMDRNRKFLEPLYRRTAGRAKWEHLVEILNSLGNRKGDADSWWKTWVYLRGRAEKAFNEEENYERDVAINKKIAKILGIDSSEELDDEESSSTELDKENTISLSNTDPLSVGFNSPIEILDEGDTGDIVSIDSLIDSSISDFLSSTSNDSAFSGKQQNSSMHAETTNSISMRKSVLSPSPVPSSSQNKQQQGPTLKFTKATLKNSSLLSSPVQSQIGKQQSIVVNAGIKAGGQNAEQSNNNLLPLLKKITDQLDSVLFNLKSLVTVNTSCQCNLNNLENMLQNLNLSELNKSVNNVATAESQTSSALTLLLSQLITQCTKNKI